MTKKWNGIADNPAGEIFHELSVDEMVSIVGGKSEQAQSTPVVSVIVSISEASSTYCASALASVAISAVSGVISYRHC